MEVTVIKQHQVQKIKYVKDNGETSERVVIPSFVPKSNIKAIDVTEYSEEKQVELQQIMEDYNEYVKQQMQTIFSFEDWAAHTLNIDLEPKWRTFKKDNIEIL